MSRVPSAMDVVDAKPLQLATVCTGGRGKTSGVREASRKLGVETTKSHRAIKIDSIAPAAKQAARDAGLDKNQSALLKVAAAPVEQQVAAVERITSCARPVTAASGRTPAPIDNVQPLPPDWHEAATFRTRARRLGSLGGWFDLHAIRSPKSADRPPMRGQPNASAALGDRGPLYSGRLVAGLKEALDALWLWMARDAARSIATDNMLAAIGVKMISPRCRLASPRSQLRFRRRGMRPCDFARCSCRRAASRAPQCEPGRASVRCRDCARLAPPARRAARTRWHAGLPFGAG